MSPKELKGRYKIIKELGVGGFGKTYLAEDTHRPGCPHCVVKQLMPISKNIEFLQVARHLFNTEAETLEKLGYHPQIPQLLAYFEEHEEFYLVEQFIQGSCLTIKLAEGKLPEVEVIKLIKDILDVLEFIHAQSIIHRDIKPSNIIKTQNGRYILIDFGAVKQLQPYFLKEQDITLTTFNIGIGTTDYAPLEQLANQPRFNSDIYSLGIVAIQALTGVPPSQLKRTRNGAVIWRDLTQVNEDLARIINKMVCPAFTQRYQSATAILQDLAQLKHTSFSTPSNIDKTSAPLRLTTEQYTQLEELLKEFIGVIAPVLLEQLMQVSNDKELLENLSVHISQKQRLDFQNKAQALLRESVFHQTDEFISNQKNNDSYVNRCQQELTDLIGPIGTFLVENVVQSYPDFSLEEIVDILAAEIPNSRKAAEFRHRLLS